MFCLRRTIKFDIGDKKKLIRKEFSVNAGETPRILFIMGFKDFYGEYCSKTRYLDREIVEYFDVILVDSDK